VVPCVDVLSELGSCVLRYDGGEVGGGRMNKGLFTLIRLHWKRGGLKRERKILAC
jgi:hypothetical protein